MLGLEYTGQELAANLRKGFPSGIADLVLNFSPGLAAGLLLGWKPLPAVLLAGVTYISSSGIVAKILGELGWLSNQETPSILTVLVLEDLAMAVYLPTCRGIACGRGRLHRSYFSYGCNRSRSGCPVCRCTVRPWHQPACSSRVRRDYPAFSSRDCSAGRRHSAAFAGLSRDWRLSCRHRRFRADSRAIAPVVRAPARSFCRNILFLFWAGD